MTTSRAVDFSSAANISGSHRAPSWIDLEAKNTVSDPNLADSSRSSIATPNGSSAWR
jgi:hypothetical protein